MVALGHSEPLLWKEGLCSLWRGGDSQKNIECPMWESQAIVCVECWQWEPRGSFAFCGRRERDGNQPGIHLPWSGMEIWPASLPEFFLEGGPTGLPGNACFGFLAICILFKERLQEQIEAFSKKSVKNPNFFFSLSPFRFGIRRTIYIYTRHGGHWSPCRSCVYF